MNMRPGYIVGAKIRERMSHELLHRKLDVPDEYVQINNFWSHEKAEVKCR
jgi:hypothetical protein